MHAALMSFATAVHRERLDYVDEVLSSCAKALGAPGGDGAASENTANGMDGGGESAAAEGKSPPMIVADVKGVRQLVALLTVPLDTYDVVSVLGLSSYPRVVSLLQPMNMRQMATTIVRAVPRQDESLRRRRGWRRSSVSSRCS